MEGFVLKEIVNGNTAVLVIVVFFIYRKLGELNGSVSKLNDTLVDVITMTAVQKQKFTNLEEKVNENKEEISNSRANIHELRSEVHYVKNKMVTRDQVIELMKD